MHLGLLASSVSWADSVQAVPTALTMACPKAAAYTCRRGSRLRCFLSRLLGGLEIKLVRPPRDMLEDRLYRPEGQPVPALSRPAVRMPVPQGTYPASKESWDSSSDYARPLVRAT